MSTTSADSVNLKFKILKKKKKKKDFQKAKLELATCQQVLVKTLESPLDSKKTKPVNLKRHQRLIFIGKLIAEAPILSPHDAKRQHIGKDTDAGKD